MLDVMRQTGAYRSDDDLLRGALFWYGRFLGLNLHHDVFALARPVARRRKDSHRCDLPSSI